MKTRRVRAADSMAASAAARGPRSRHPGMQCMRKHEEYRDRLRSRRGRPRPRPPRRRIVRPLRPDRPATCAAMPSRTRGTGAIRSGHRWRRRDRVLPRRPPRCDGVTGDDRPLAPASRGSGSTATGRRVRGPGRSPRRSSAGPPRFRRRRRCRRRSAPGPAGPDRRVRGRSSGRVVPDPGCRRTTTSVEHGLVGQRPREYRGAPPRGASVSSVEHGVEPGQPFQDAAARKPQRLQRRRQLPAPARCRRFPGSSRMRLGGCPSRLGLLEPLLVVGARRRVQQRGHRRVVVAMARTGRPRPRRTRRASPARIGAPFPAAGIAFGHWCFRRPPATCRRAGRADRGPDSAPPRRRRRPIGRRSRSNPPRNTASRRNRMRSVSVSNACDQSTEARNVCWRRTAVRAPPVNSRKRSCRLSMISVRDNARTRAAASSMASGIPSRRGRSRPRRRRCRR